jgi:hypothetical protein
MKKHDDIRQMFLTYPLFALDRIFSADMTQFLPSVNLGILPRMGILMLGIW